MDIEVTRAIIKRGRELLDTRRVIPEEDRRLIVEEAATFERALDLLEELIEENNALRVGRRPRVDIQP